MPELPELEILKAEMNDRVMGKEINGVVVNQKKNPHFPLEDFKRVVMGARIVNTARRGKMLCIELSNGNALLVHLMMVGQVLFTRSPGFDEMRTELVLQFKDGSRLLVNNVDLNFFHFDAKEKIEALPQVRQLGLDPLDDAFTLQIFKERIGSRKGKVKSLLMDQAFIAGIGNTYVDELLFAAEIRPDRQVNALADDEIEHLYFSIKETLQKGIDSGGASDIAFVHLDGSRGAFQECFRVNRRKGKPCLVCGAAVKKIKVAGRGTYLCPVCQK